jgi:hypothetical protein
MEKDKHPFMDKHPFIDKQIHELYGRDHNDRSNKKARESDDEGRMLRLSAKNILIKNTAEQKPEKKEVSKDFFFLLII